MAGKSPGLTRSPSPPFLPLLSSPRQLLELGRSTGILWVGLGPGTAQPALSLLEVGGQLFSEPHSSDLSSSCQNPHTWNTWGCSSDLSGSTRQGWVQPPQEGSQGFRAPETHGWLGEKLNSGALTFRIRTSAKRKPPLKIGNVFRDNHWVRQLIKLLI